MSLVIASVTELHPMSCVLQDTQVEGDGISESTSLTGDCLDSASAPLFALRNAGSCRRRALMNQLLIYDHNISLSPRNPHGR